MFETPVTSSPLVRPAALQPARTRTRRARACRQPARWRRRSPPRADAQVANFLSNLPAYRTGVSPLLRGVEIGLTHGFFVSGPFSARTRSALCAERVSEPQCVECEPYVY